MKLISTLILALFSSLIIYGQDTQAPVMTSFSILPTSVDVSNNAANLTFSANITDDLSGVSFASITIQLPNGTFQSVNASLTAGTNLNGTWEATFVIPKLSQPGTGSLTQILLFDGASNTRFYTSPGFPPGPTTFTVVNTNPPDNIPPTLVSFVISPTSVDVSANSQIITVTATLTDNISGVRTVSASIMLPNGTTINSNGTLIPLESTLNGDWELEFTIPKFTLPGTANLSGLTAVDTSGNTISYPTMDIALSSLGITSFTINNSNPDSEAPILTSFTVTPSSVNITTEAKEITVSATATDDIAGVRSALITIQLPSGGFLSNNAIFNTMDMGTTLNGTWDAVFTIPLLSQPGTGKIFQVVLSDSANINKSYVLAELTLLGPDFTVVNDAVMPVQWVRPITASIQNKYSIIEWSTASQINNEKFIIEHSNNGREFIYAGEQKGEGNSSEIKAYSFVHESPSSGMNYYRIKQMDFDGKYSYSNIASVTYKSRDLMIYPNPVKNEVIITSSEDHQMQILDVYGRLVISKSLHEGQNSISMAELQSGTYILLLQNGEHYKIIKE